MILRSIAKYLISLMMLSGISATAITQDQIRVMPLGNSITRGTMCVNGEINSCVENENSDAVGYRQRLHNLLDSSGYNVDFIGANSNGYAHMSDPEHSGFSRMRNYQIAEIMETGYTSEWGFVTSGPYLNTYPAQLILIHSGTNDVLQNQGVQSITYVDDILEAIEDFETAYGQPVLVFVSRIIKPRASYCETYDDTKIYNNSLASLVQNRVNNGQNLVLVDLECGAGINYYTEMADMLHPSQLAYDKMGDSWFDAINNYNTAPVLNIPNQVSDRGTTFNPLNLDLYVDDAEDNDENLVWSYSPASLQNFDIAIDGNRNVTITPKDSAWSGSEELSFTVTDQGRILSQLKKSSQMTITLTVNWMPEITGQEELSTPRETPLSLQVSDITMVEPDKAPGDLALLLSDGPHFSFSGTTITPDKDYVGDLTVPVRLSGGGKVSTVYNLAVEVTAVNNPPEFVTTELDPAQSNLAYEFVIEAEDEDPDDQLSFEAIQKPEWLSIDALTGMLSGFPARADTGISELQLSVFDGLDATKKSFSIEVEFYNHPPEFHSVPADSVVVETTYLYGAIADDFESDPLSYFASELPSWAEFIPEGQVLIGTPENEDFGTSMAIIGTTDGIDTVFQEFNIEVIFHTAVESEENKFSSQISVYPNPVAEQLFIRISERELLKEKLRFIISDMSGRTLFETSINDASYKISLPAHIQNGTYLYRIHSESRQAVVKTGKIIKLR